MKQFLSAKQDWVYLRLPAQIVFLSLTVASCSSHPEQTAVSTDPGKVTWLVSRTIDKRGFTITLVNRSKDFLAMPRYGVTTLTLLNDFGLEVRPDLGIAARSVLEADWVVIAPGTSESWSVPPGNNKVPAGQGFAGYGAKVTVYTKSMASLPMPQFCRDVQAELAEPPTILELDRPKTL